MANQDEHPSSTGLAESAGLSTFARLRRYNLIMGFLHLGQGIAMLLLSSDFALPITTSYLTFDTATQTLQPVVNQFYELRIGPAVAAFLFMSSFAHFLLSTVFYGWYVKNLRHHINRARWIEYAFSSSLMIVIIAMLTGLYDLSGLILIFAVNAAMILFGWMMELHNQTTSRTSWTAFIFGCLAGIVPWIVIGLHLAGDSAAGGSPPTFVYFIFGSIFVFFNIFALNQFLQYKKVGKWRDYLYGESAYIMLSLVAKSLLAWQVFAGTLRPV